MNLVYNRNHTLELNKNGFFLLYIIQKIIIEVGGFGHQNFFSLETLGYVNQLSYKALEK